ncbi:MAG: ATP-dependent RecD-like DNA helicase [Ruminococcus sp.]|nr:ATP-dependent RecD-like DNA helicase [Oscillospiraceae bacterium]MDY4414370.1 ATP-dependent RecD-like DNA helicase [Ruminococcus sp.]
MEEKDIRIEGTVESVLFKNESNGYIVLDLNAGDELVTVVGELGDIECGEILTVEGNYTFHPRFGKQFCAVYCERKLPDDTVNIEKYLSSGAVKGIGRSLAKRIVSVFGKDTLEIIEKTPQRLMEVKGISKNKYNEIKNDIKKLFALRNVASYLTQYGIRTQFAMRAYQRFGEHTLETIRKNPYYMCQEGIELDFSKADLLASEQNFKRNDSRRIIAGIQYILSQNALGGHSCLPLDRICEKAQVFLDVSESDFYDAYGQALEERELFEYCKNKREFVYLQEYYSAEKFIAVRLNLCSKYISKPDCDCDFLIDIEESENNIKYESLQRKAISEAVSKGVLVMTGGPGTGKTTSINAIISIFEKMDCEVALTAPTGRASKRMSELTGRESKTIHRLLEVEFDSAGRHKFIHDANNPLSCDAIIIDEMSMVDVQLFSSLLCALRFDCKIIMVGDSDQLPSVGAGNLLKDIIDSGAVPVVQLKEVFRQAKSSCIITNAHKIINGEFPDLKRHDNDFFFFKRTDCNNILQLISDLAGKRLPDAYKYSPFENIQVLSPSKKGILGVIEINRFLQRHLNPPEDFKPEIRNQLYTLRLGDKVMQTKNNYNIVWYKDDESGSGIYNGDIGRIEKINRSSMEVTVNFDGRTAVYTADMLSQLELAYAITVHKSQGCEFDAVIMPVTCEFKKLCYRNLLYTAVTRAKKLLILIGTEDDIREMTENSKKTSRYTCLAYMLRRYERKIDDAEC